MGCSGSKGEEVEGGLEVIDGYEMGFDYNSVTA